MIDFLKALTTLNAADLVFFGPDAPVKSNKPTPRPRKAKVAKEAVTPEKAMMALEGEVTPVTAPQSITAEPTAQQAKADPISPPAERPYGEHKLPVFVPPARTRPARDWPAIGTVLVAEYFGATYHAEVVAAKKRLKSGKQLRLLDGPGKGKRLDSYSKAMMVATAKQRRTEKRGRQGVANGWEFWRKSEQADNA